MDIIPEHIKVLTYLFLIVYMLSVGLETPRGKILSLLGSSKVIAFALLANLVLVPLACFILLRFFNVSPDIKTGLLLLAFAPGGLFALNFARVSKGNVQLAAGLLILLSLIGIVSTPLFAQFFLQVHEDIGRVFRTGLLLVMLVLLPIYIGKYIATLVSPTIAQKLAKWTGLLSILLFVAVTLLSSKIKSPAIKQMRAGELATIVILVGISWVVGWLLGGPEVRNKKVMAIATSLRNVGVCVPIAIHEFSSTNVIVPILAFSGIAIPMNFLFSLITKFVFRDDHESKTVEPVTRVASK